MEREERIQHAMDLYSDMVPYDDPNYWESLREIAENYVDWEDDGCPISEDWWFDEDDWDDDDYFNLPL